MQSNDTIRIGKKAFLFSCVVLLCLMILSGVLTYILDAGSYTYEEIDGRMAIVQGTYHTTDVQPLPFYRWLTAPFEVLAGPDAATIIVIIVFLLFLGGSFSVVASTGTLRYAIQQLVSKFGYRKYLVLSVTSFFFMFLGTAVGIFEESVLLAPIAVSLALGLGFDVYTGLFISVLSTGFGFATGVFNPFTTGVAQTLAGVEVFSGAGFRLLAFVIIYGMLNIFIQIHARRVEKKQPANAASVDEAIQGDSKYMKRGVFSFSGMLLIMVLWVVMSTMVDGLADYTMPALALIFLLGGIVTGLVAGQGMKKIGTTLAKGAVALLPGVLLILMASSVKYIMFKGGVLDTLLFTAGQWMEGMGPYSSVLAIYALVMVLNFFIGSGSAKAFLVIPIIAPLTAMSGLGQQTAIMAFLFGDGFSNTFYITNAVLLVTLGITGVSYADWFKRTGLLQLVTLGVTAGLLLLACAVGY